MDILDPKFPYYVVISIVTISLGQLFECLYSRTKRNKDAHYEREIYHRKLEYDSLVIEREKLKEELQSLESIKELLDEKVKLESQLDEDNIELDEFMFNNELESLSREQIELEDKANEIETLENDICLEKRKLLDSTNETNDNNDLELSAQKVVSNIKYLESENQKLKTQLEHRKILAPVCEVDSDVNRFVDNHENELTLDFLEKAYDTLIKLKASNPSEGFDKHINDMKSKQDQVKELAELQLEIERAKIKLEPMKKRYEDELSSLNEARVEHLFKICGIRQLKDTFKGKLKIQEEMKINLEKELDTKRSERSILRDKFHDAEQQCNVYWQAWKDTEVKRKQLEAERRADLERERRFFTESMNMSSRSSNSGGSQIPPPPPISVPTVDEILRLTANQSIGSHFGNFSMNQPSSIPSPPPIDVPLNEIFANRSISTKSVRSNSSTGGDNRTRVGSSYGKVLNFRPGGLGR